MQIRGTEASTSSSEIVRVTAINRNTGTATVVREQLSTSNIASGGDPIDSNDPIYRVNLLYCPNTTQFNLYGGDYRNIFTPNTLYKVNTNEATDTGDAWPILSNWSVVRYSDYTEPASAGNYTTVYLESSTDFHNDAASVGNTTHGGIASHYYTSLNGALPFIETNVLKVPGRLNQFSNLPTLNVSGIVTRNLEIREFLNTEKYASQSSHRIVLATKELDFGDVSQSVKLYKVTINARSVSGHLEVEAITDNTNSYHLVTRGGAQRFTLRPNFSTISLYFGANSESTKSLKIKSLKLFIKGVVRGFELNDISVTYRTMGGPR